MKAPHPSSDPLLKSLADDAADLPVRAAIEARTRIARRQQTRRKSAIAASALLIAIITWIEWPVPGKPAASGNFPTNPVTKHQVHRTLPTILSAEQTTFVNAAGDMPLLLVRNSAGQVTRIHLIER